MTGWATAAASLAAQCAGPASIRGPALAPLPHQLDHQGALRASPDAYGNGGPAVRGLRPCALRPTPSHDDEHHSELTPASPRPGPVLEQLRAGPVLPRPGATRRSPPDVGWPTLSQSIGLSRFTTRSAGPYAVHQDQAQPALDECRVKRGSSKPSLRSLTTKNLGGRTLHAWARRRRVVFYRRT